MKNFERLISFSWLFCLAFATAHAEPSAPPKADVPKFDEAGLRQLGPEHLQLVYCGAKAALAQIPESRKRLEKMSKDPQSSALFDKKATAETRKMIDASEKDTQRIVTTTAREFRHKSKKKISDAPCAAYTAALTPATEPVLAACHTRYRFVLAEKLDAEVRSRAVASEFRERFRDQLAQDLVSAKAQLAVDVEKAKATDKTFDLARCHFDKGIAYAP